MSDETKCTVIKSSLGKDNGYYAVYTGRNVRSKIKRETTTTQKLDARSQFIFISVVLSLYLVIVYNSTHHFRYFTHCSHIISRTRARSRSHTYTHVLLSICSNIFLIFFFLFSFRKVNILVATTIWHVVFGAI